MNRLSTERRGPVISCLVEGMSGRATVRVTGVAKNTIVKLLTDLGEACSEYQDRVLRNLPCKAIECDEIWSFCYSKAKNVPIKYEDEFGYGDVWTWTAIDADTKLMVSYFVGDRSGESALILVDDLRSRLANRVQISTDGHRVYLEAIEGAFGGDVDYGQVIKLYGATPGGPGRYSPAECTGIKKRVVEGDPEEKHISTSYIERSNLSIRMQNRRFTRLTNAFSKKFQNHAHMLALYFAFYNFVRIHKTLRMTPAMAAGVVDTLWTMEDIAERIEARKAKPAKRGPYEKRANPDR